MTDLICIYGFKFLTFESHGHIHALGLYKETLCSSKIGPRSIDLLRVPTFHADNSVTFLPRKLKLGFN